MKIRVKFSKYGALKFIGHLDVMRFFQKAIRRAELDICYSEGYSPHQIMSFAAPLGLGVTSDAEYMDIEVHTTLSKEEAMARLNEQMVEGIKVLDYTVLSEDSKNAMSIVAAASYEIRCRYDKKSYFNAADLDAFLSQNEILVEKKTKKNLVTLDIRPLIYHAKMTGEHQDVLSICIRTGSSTNLKPELLLNAFAAFKGEENAEFDFLIHRTEVYANAAKEEETPVFVPLNEFGAA